MEAVKFEDDAVRVDMTRCIGCGVCVRQCPQGVLELRRRSANVPPRTTVHVVAQMIQERGKADRAIRAYIKELI
jgi:Fe-S-cluster-containing hydrogenase component 2